MLKFTFSAPSSRIITVIVQIGTMKIYIAIREELGKNKTR
jgi:hypothetical protein